ncbi:MAG: hypothetical protein R3F11_12155 [Verrucomicrobiales bacterium]
MAKIAVVVDGPPGSVVLDGTGVAGGQVMVRLHNVSHARVEGFEIRNLAGATDGSGIRVTGSGAGVELIGNRIHGIRGQNAMGITVYATAAAPISGLRVIGNEIFNCEPRPSEALTLNGNVTEFEVGNRTCTTSTTSASI